MDNRQTTERMDLRKRRLRYEGVFALLIIAVCVITVLNINIGSVRFRCVEDKNEGLE